MTCITAAMLPSLLGRPVAYQPIFTKLPGVTVAAAIFLSQALFLCNTPTARRRDGWFWKEQQGESDSWEAETGMSAKQQVTARRQLIRIGVLEEVRKGVPAKTWYWVNTEALAHRLAEALSDDEPPEHPANPDDSHNLPSRETENAQAENQQSPNGSAQNCPNGDFLQRLLQRVPPLSGASEPNVFERAAQQTDDGPPPPSQPRRHPMTLDWQPDPEQLAMACQRAGLPDDLTAAPHQLAKFTAHHADHPARQHSATAWTAKLVDWLRNDLRAASPATGGIPHAQRQPAAGGYDRNLERDRIAEQLANPHDQSWADGMWPDDDAEPGAQGGNHGAGQPGVHPA
ncbi:DnaT-like ssDNA-binding domain-containing protein [Halomonas korlensis]|uniref:DnaT DNA-binding domain-containing protein n=1 Tax=Halomonas korlensis TaxID=463301 RepID=A0A1I7JMC4_9GAMM|nr:DnaT-like ssDNA-binding domain-containing protein [Halomonas korlensis]SFU86306.1 hypothetical protein SAMN04487955_11169 [Halomonas korlensis]